MRQTEKQKTALSHFLRGNRGRNLVAPAFGEMSEIEILDKEGKG